MKKTLIALMMMGLSTGAMADYKKSDTTLHCKDLDGDGSRQWYLNTKKGWLYNTDGHYMGALGVDHKSFTYMQFTKFEKSIGVFGYHWDRNTGLMRTSIVYLPEIKKYTDKGEMSLSEGKQWRTLLTPYLEFRNHEAFRFFDQKITADGPTKGQNISAGEKDHNGFTANDYHKRFFNAIDSWPALKLASDAEKIERNGHYTEYLAECRKINQTLEKKF